MSSSRGRFAPWQGVCLIQPRLHKKHFSNPRSGIFFLKIGCVHFSCCPLGFPTLDRRKTGSCLLLRSAHSNSLFCDSRFSLNKEKMVRTLRALRNNPNHTVAEEPKKAAIWHLTTDATEQRRLDLANRLKRERDIAKKERDALLVPF